MEIERKLSILAQAARYDRVCGKGKEEIQRKALYNDMRDFIFYSPLCQRKVCAPFKGAFYELLHQRLACTVITGALTTQKERPSSLKNLHM